MHSRSLGNMGGLEVVEYLQRHKAGRCNFVPEKLIYDRGHFFDLIDNLGCVGRQWQITVEAPLDQRLGLGIAQPVGDRNNLCDPQVLVLANALTDAAGDYVVSQEAYEQDVRREFL